MKMNFQKFSTLFFLLIILVGCDDSFSPKGEFEDGYSLFCVIDGNLLTQRAYLTKNYNPQNLTPETYDEDKSISGAELNLSYPDTSYTFLDSVLYSENDEKKFNAYFVKNFRSKGSNLFIKAVMPDGVELTSSLSCTKDLKFSYESIKGIKYDLEEIYTVAFYDKPEAFYFNPKLFINYSVRIGNEDIIKRIEVPKRYVVKNDSELPVYPELALRNEYYYSILIIEKTLRKITEFEQKNYQIIIKNLSLEVLEVSYPLAVYFEKNKTFSDGFTIKAQQPEFTNIKGGNGLFGYKYTSKLDVGFAKEWEKIFIDMGYKIKF